MYSTLTLAQLPAPAISLQSMAQIGGLIVVVVGLFATGMRIANSLGANTQALVSLRESLPVLITNAKQELRLEVQEIVQTITTAVHARIDAGAEERGRLRERLAVLESKVDQHAQQRRGER